MTEQPKYHVGQELWRHDVNSDRRGGPQRVTITKVGRKLVTIKRSGRPEVFRIDTGRTNDAYGHGSLCTDEEHAEHIARSEAFKRIGAHGLRFERGEGAAFDVRTINAIADLLDDATSPAPTPNADETGASA